MNIPDTRPVVVGVDGAPGSAGAVRYGIAEARRRRVGLHLVHVVAIPPPKGSAGAVAVAALRPTGTVILERAASTTREVASDLEISTELVDGSREAGIVGASAEAQLVVVGRETRGGADRMIAGTTTASVAARAACDVVVVPSFWSASRPCGRVVVGIKTQRNAHRLLSRAFAGASVRGATLTMVTAWGLPDPSLDRIEVRTHAAEWETDARRVHDALLTQWRTAYPDVPVTTQIVHGRAADVLLQASLDADLLLVSRSRHTITPQGRLGGVAHAVLRLSDVPVQVVPYAGGAPESGAGCVVEATGAPPR